MTKANIIRFLVGINLFIFLLPFFNMCSTSNLKKEHQQISTNISNDTTISASEKKELLQTEKYRFNSQKKSIDSNTLNGYELGSLPFRKAEMKMFKDAFFYFSICFTVLIISSIITVFLVWKDRYKPAQLFVVTSIAVLIISLLIPLFTNTLQHLDQIKIGYYALFFNLLLTFWMLSGELQTKSDLID